MSRTTIRNRFYLKTAAPVIGGGGTACSQAVFPEGSRLDKSRRAAMPPAARTLICTGVLVVSITAGCSGKYKHERIGPDAEVFVQVQSLLAHLRASGADGLDEVLADNCAGGLAPHQAAGRKAALERLASADSAGLTRLDRFGPDVYRATFDLGHDGQTRQMCMLLVRSDGRLLWAGRI